MTHTITTDTDETKEEVAERFANHMRNGNVATAARALTMARPSYGPHIVEAYLEQITPSHRFGEVARLLAAMDKREISWRTFVQSYLDEPSRGPDIPPSVNPPHDE